MGTLGAKVLNKILAQFSDTLSLSYMQGWLNISIYLANQKQINKCDTLKTEKSHDQFQQMQKKHLTKYSFSK